MTGAERHAQRLLRCYPQVWRQRYGDELAALLVDDLADRPRSRRRDLDVVRAGLCARLASWGLARGPVRNRSAAIAIAAAASVAFVASALSIWTQLADGVLTAPPDTSAVLVSLVVLSTWLGGLLILVGGLGMKMLAGVVRAVRAGHAVPMLGPLIALAASTTFLIVGAGQMASRWPGARLVHHESVLAHTARLGWAATDSISTFWLHPNRLLTLPAGELAWMVLCPIAVVACGWAVVRVLLATGFRSPRMLPRAASVTPFATLLCLAGAATWVLTSQHAANTQYRAGTLDLVLIAVMAASAGVIRNSWSTQA